MTKKRILKYFSVLIYIGKFFAASELKRSHVSQGFLVEEEKQQLDGEVDGGLACSSPEFMIISSFSQAQCAFTKQQISHFIFINS